MHHNVVPESSSICFLLKKRWLIYMTEYFSPMPLKRDTADLSYKKGQYWKIKCVKDNLTLTIGNFLYGMQFYL